MKLPSFEPDKLSTAARIGDPMHLSKVIDQRLLIVGLMLFFIFGCASDRGSAGVERVAREPVDQQDVNVAQKHEPPPNVPAQGNKAQYRYHYYPASEVYFSTWRRLYFYTEGDIWVSDAMLPYRLRAGLGEYITVEIYADTPYEYHRYVYKKDYKYPAGQAKKKESGVKF